MSAFALWSGALLVAFGVTRRAGRQFARTAALRTRNYRGLELPTAGGVAVLLGILGGVGVVALWRAVFPGSERVDAAAATGVPFLAVALGFGLLGLWDDLAPAEGRGWRAHLRALGRARATGGAVKLAGGAALSLAVAAPGASGIGWALVDGAIVALSANLFNLLDVRPGRAGKVALVAAVPMLVVGGPAAPALAAAAGAVIAFLPLDLRERAMLGDAGANALGAVVGLAIVVVGSDPARIVALILLVVLHVAGDEPGLSRIFRGVPPLRAFDAAGRVRAEP